MVFILLIKELISFETDKLKLGLSEIIPQIAKSLIEEIAKIKNPNETLFDLMKNFYILIFPGKHFLWNIFQVTSFNFRLNLKISNWLNKNLIPSYLKM